jgi:hypothetical protein
MKTKLIPLSAVGMALACSFTPALSFARAASVAPIDDSYWICHADCFVAGGDDGSNLFYAGNLISEPSLDEQTAFDDITDQCDGGELYHRTLVKTETETTTAVFNQAKEIYWWRGSGYWSNTEVIKNHRLRGIFKMKEATLTNACEKKPASKITINETGDGDPISN